MNNLNNLISTAQGRLNEPEEFQALLIKNITGALKQPSRPPCLLRAPTASGKTFMMSRILADMSAHEKIMWFWFVPFTTLVPQTQDAILSNSSDLSPILLEHGRNQEPEAGQVHISTANAVASSLQRNRDYDGDADDEKRSISQLVNLARVRAIKIGVVVDEAHIGLDKGTEFGKFINWLNPEFMLMATATPKDPRLNEFLVSSGKSSFKNFSVSRDDVVKARLNKKYVKAFVYKTTDKVKSIADLKSTVLREALKRNWLIKDELVKVGISLSPLLLVQVENGDDTIDEAEKSLISLGVNPAAIGKHSSAKPDPVMMASIARDPSKEVLIFKQSAGTGFDAPRAFVLISTKLVNDKDFALQFLGRVMRVSQEIRAKYNRSTVVPSVFDTAYIYLANPEHQSGFQSAVDFNKTIQSQIEGETEKMNVHVTQSGRSIITNFKTNQDPLMYDLAINHHVKDDDCDVSDDCPNQDINSSTPAKSFEIVGQFSMLDEDIEIQEKAEKLKPSANKPLIKSSDEFIDAIGQKMIKAYPISKTLKNIAGSLKTEKRPEIDSMQLISEKVATRFSFSANNIEMAVSIALGTFQGKEINTELTSHGNESTESRNISIAINRAELSRGAFSSLLDTLPLVEEEDVRIILRVFASRMGQYIKKELVKFDIDGDKLKSMVEAGSRVAAEYLSRQCVADIAEMMYQEISDQAILINADPLPKAMLFPTELALDRSNKNIYGVFPPSKEQLEQVSGVIISDDRMIIKDATYKFDDGEFITGQYDASSSLNNVELSFAKALDECEFVAWWHRNPDRKPYSVRIVRGEHKNFFYPDFVICLEHIDGSAPLVRLVETKQDVKDAARKSKHFPEYYGKILFLTKDGDKLRTVNDNGSLGDEVDLDGLDEMREWMRQTTPSQ